MAVGVAVFVPSKRPKARAGQAVPYQRPDGRWTVSSRIGGKRFWVYGSTPGEVAAKRDKLRGDMHATVLDAIYRRRSERTRVSRRVGSLEIAERVLRHARTLGWDDRFIAQVMVAWLSPNRRRLGVFGPCYYCGDWIANTVDHVIARARGGTDDPANLVSACQPCNVAKGDRDVDEFVASRASARG